MEGPEFEVTLFALPRLEYVGTPVRVPLRAYLAFINRLEGQLRELEARWAPRGPQMPVSRFFVRRPR